eukprot:417979_1
MNDLLEKDKKLHAEWENLCKSTNHKTIVTFFDSHQKEILSARSPWFLKALIYTDDIESIKYIFNHTNPRDYINVKDKSGPLDWAIESTFEMIRLLVANGA